MVGLLLFGLHFFLSAHVTNPVTFSPVAPSSHGGETLYKVIYKSIEMVDALKESSVSKEREKKCGHTQVALAL